MTNTDDFLWRLVKGCIQLGLVPDMNNTVNMVPVDHVARCCSLAAISPLPLPLAAPAPDPGMAVLHVAASPRPTFNAFLGALAAHGFATARSEYVAWRRALERHVMEAQDNALFPLLHFVLDDLPTSTRAPELDDANMRKLLRAAGEGEKGECATVDEELMGRYLAWLVDAEFLERPREEEKAERRLPKLVHAPGTVLRAVGRSSGN